MVLGFIDFLLGGKKGNKPQKNTPAAQPVNKSPAAQPAQAGQQNAAPQQGGGGGSGEDVQFEDANQAPAPAQGGGNRTKISEAITKLSEEVKGSSEKLTRLVTDFKALENNVNTLGHRIDELEEARKTNDEKLSDIDNNMTKFLSLYELVNNQFNPFVEKGNPMGVPSSNSAPQAIAINDKGNSSGGNIPYVGGENANKGEPKHIDLDSEEDKEEDKEEDESPVYEEESFNSSQDFMKKMEEEAKKVKEDFESKQKKDPLSQISWQQKPADMPKKEMPRMQPEQKDNKDEGAQMPQQPQSQAGQPMEPMPEQRKNEMDEVLLDLDTLNIEEATGAAVPLTHLRNNTNSLVTILSWLEYLTSRAGVDETRNTLRYYTEVLRWITPEVFFDLDKYLRGMRDKRSYNGASLSIKDHIVSLYFISKLNDKTLDEKLTKAVLQIIKQ